jgi:dCTP deaminase
MSVKLPVRVYPRMPIGQLIYFEISGKVDRGYGEKPSAKYRSVSDRPIPSRMYLNFGSKIRSGRPRRPARRRKHS